MKTNPFRCLTPCLLFILVFFTTSCSSQNQNQNQYSIDGYSFYVPSGIEEWKGEDTDENVHLILSDPEGLTVIIQNNMNLLKQVYFPKLDEQNTLRSMHQLKFDSYIESLNGYDVSDLIVTKIGAIPYSIQTFKYMVEEDQVELAYDLRVVLLDGNYYAWYSFDSAVRLDKNKERINEVIRSLSKENLE